MNHNLRYGHYQQAFSFNHQLEDALAGVSFVHPALLENKQECKHSPPQKAAITNQQLLVFDHHSGAFQYTSP